MSQTDSGDILGRAECPIVILQQARTPVISNLECQISDKISQCCISKGSVGIKAVLNSSVLTLGDVAEVRLQVDNTEGKKGIKEVVVALKRKVTISERHGVYHELEHDLVSIGIPGCKSGESAPEKAVTFDLTKVFDLATPETLKGSLEEYSGKIQPTCNGKYLNNQYTICITTELDTLVPVDDPPCLRIPVELISGDKILGFCTQLYTPVVTAEAE